MPLTLDELTVEIGKLKDESQECKSWRKTHDALVPELRREQNEVNDRHCKMIREINEWRRAIDKRLVLVAIVAAGGSGGITWLVKLFG